MTHYSNAQLRNCAKREAVQRRRVYPRLIDQGKMTDGFARIQIEMMDQIAAHFGRLAEKDEPSLLNPETRK